MAGNEYTLEQIRSMQDEATKRVREMNQRSRQFTENQQNNNQEQTIYYNRDGQYSNKPQHNPPPKPEHKPENPPPKKEQKKSPFGLNFLKSLDLKSLIGENSEQAMLLLLILLLMNEPDSDEILIFALIYIML